MSGQRRLQTLLGVRTRNALLLRKRLRRSLDELRSRRKPTAELLCDLAPRIVQIRA